MSEIIKRQIEFDVTMNDDVKFPIVVDIEIDTDQIANYGARMALWYVRGQSKAKAVRGNWIDDGKFVVKATLKPDSKQVRDVMVRLHGKGSAGRKKNSAGDQKFRVTRKAKEP